MENLLFVSANTGDPDHFDVDIHEEDWAGPIFFFSPLFAVIRNLLTSTWAVDGGFWCATNNGQNNEFDSHPSPKAGKYLSFYTGRLNPGMDGDKQSAS